MTPSPSQPNQPQYQLSVLNLFPVYSTRAAYLQATGQQAPPYEPTQPVKTWADPSPAGEAYNVFDPATPANVDAALSGGPGSLSLVVIPLSEAGSVNLPGAYDYAPWVPAPTDAVEWGPVSPIGPVDPSTVCTQEQAQQIADDLAPLFPGKPPSVQLAGPGYYHIVYGLDPRRQWYIVFGTGQLAPTFLAGQLLTAMYAYGYEAPGEWKMSTPPQASTGMAYQGTPVWVPAPQVTAPPGGGTTTLVPLRTLLPNEQIVHLPGSPFNPQGTWVIERTDMQQAQPPNTIDTVAASQASQAAQIASLENQLQQVLALLQAKS